MYWTKLMAAAAALSLAGCAHKQEPARSPAAQTAAPVAVSTIEVKPVEWDEVFEVPGTVRARKSAVLSSRMPAYVREIAAQAGDRVREGQILVRLDTRDLDAALRQAQAAVEEAKQGVPEAASAEQGAQAQVNLAEVTLRRMRELLDKRSVSQQEFDEAMARTQVARSALAMAQVKKHQVEFRIRQAEQAVASAQVNAGYSELKAPFTGRVIMRQVEVGELASPGRPLLVIDQEGSWRLEASVEESRLAMVNQAKAVEVRLDAVSEPLQGRLASVVPLVDESSRSFIAKIDLPGRAELRTGLFGRARFPAGKRRALAVPAGAAQGSNDAQLVTVLVAEQGLAQARIVKLGAARGGDVEVLSGLKEGDRVVHPRPAGLVDGARIEVRP